MDEPDARFSVLAGQDGTTTVTIAGVLDISNLPPLAQEVGDALQTNPSRLIVDVAEVTFADSATIALWLRWSTAVAEFELRNAPVLLRAVIVTMGLSEQLGMAT